MVLCINMPIYMKKAYHKNGLKITLRSNIVNIPPQDFPPPFLKLMCDMVLFIFLRVLQPKHNVAYLSLWTSYYCRFNLKVGIVFTLH